MVQRMSHIVDKCPTSKLHDGGLQILHSADDNWHTHPFNGPLSGATQVGRYQKGKTNLDFTEARDSEWQ